MNKSEELAKLLDVKSKYRASFWDFQDRTHFVNSKIFVVKLLELLFETDAWLLDRSLNYTENENSFCQKFFSRTIF